MNKCKQTSQRASNQKRVSKFKSGVKREGALQQKRVKEVGLKQGLVQVL
jgi:hypothetical protein